MLRLIIVCFSTRSGRFWRRQRQPRKGPGSAAEDSQLDPSSVHARERVRGWRIVPQGHVDAVGAASALTCPEFHAVLYKIRDQRAPRFRCKLGHGFSAKALLQGLATACEDALWSADARHTRGSPAGIRPSTRLISQQCATGEISCRAGRSRTCPDRPIARGDRLGIGFDRAPAYRRHALNRCAAPAAHALAVEATPARSFYAYIGLPLLG